MIGKGVPAKRMDRRRIPDSPSRNTRAASLTQFASHINAHVNYYRPSHRIDQPACTIPGCRHGYNAMPGCPTPF